jgi:hypothetical protein
MSENAFDMKIQEALRKSTRTKSDAWSYEFEHRLMTNTDLCFKETLADGSVAEFISIDSEWVRRIDFGIRIDGSEKQQILGLVSQKFPHAECFQAKYHAADYALDYEACAPPPPSHE